jgi:hypothetical protein
MMVLEEAMPAQSNGTRGIAPVKKCTPGNTQSSLDFKVRLSKVRRMSSPKLVLAMLGAAALMAACSTLSERSQSLSLGMTKEQVIKVLGKDFQTVGARESSLEGKSEVLRYKDKDSEELLVYFRDGRLVQWGDTSVLSNIPQ